MKASKKIIIVLAICIAVRFFFGFPLNNSQLPIGSDHDYHLFQVWYFANQGVNPWNYFWDAGDPIFRVYPPISHMMAGSLGNVVGFLLSYKLVSNVFMALAPIAFFLFLREFKLSDEKIILALVFFTFILVYPYYQFDGRFPSIVNLVFILIFWTFFKKSLDGKTPKNIIISSIFLSLAILTHHTTTVLILPAIFVWSILYKSNIKTVYNIIKITVLALSLSAWWVVPFVIETFSLNSGGYSGVASVSSPGGIINEVMVRINNLGISSFNPSSIFLILLTVLTGMGCILVMLKIKEKNVREFIILAVIIFILLLVVKFKRAFIFLPIPIGFLVAEGASILKKNIRIVFSALLIAALVFTFFIPRPQTSQYPYYPNIPKDGRVLFQPFGMEFYSNQTKNLHQYSILIAPIHGNENIFEWQLVSLKDIQGTPLTHSVEKTLYDSLLFNTLTTQPDNYYNLLKEGYVNYIVVNRNFNDFVQYYNSSDHFRMLDADKEYVIFELNPKTSYIEINGNYTETVLEKNANQILANFNCDIGSITVKETYNKNWAAYIDGKEFVIEQSRSGFMDIKNDAVTGPCALKLIFIEPLYYTLSVIISILTWVVLIIYLFVRMKDLTIKSGAKR